MLMIRRLALALALIATFWCAPAAAEGHGGAAPGGEIFKKLEMMMLGMWDRDGVFHMVILETQAVYMLEPPKLEKGKDRQGQTAWASELAGRLLPPGRMYLPGGV